MQALIASHASTSPLFLLNSLSHFTNFALDGLTFSLGLLVLGSFLHGTSGTLMIDTLIWWSAFEATRRTYAGPLS